MSRDLRPRELLMLEEVTGRDLLSFSRGLTIQTSKDEEPIRLATDEEYNYVGQFKYLSKVALDNCLSLYRKYGNDCTSVFEKLEDALCKLIENKEIVYEWFALWFDGKLDESFYYGTRNDEKFMEYIEEMFGEENVK